MRRCHYEVLGVERDVDDSALKKTYRKLALKWHPDKNLDNAEESTRVFREIQQAYDVLSDPQERAFYDKHREQILRGGDDYVDNSLNLMKYFSPSVYTGFGDDEQGFYGIYSWVFKTITEEDAEFVDNKEEFLKEVPEFGKSDCIYEEGVEQFYAYWQSYFTKKSYVWHDKYDIREAPNRRVLRLMEKDNKKLRDAAKKERNEEVRALVKFVKKRDKRVKVYMERLKEKEEERKRQVEQLKLEAKKEREKMFQEYQEQEWASLADLERDLDEMDNHLDSEFGRVDDVTGSQSDEEDVEQFYCVACDKSFKSTKALANHEKSRKHKENVALIKEELAKMDLGDEDTTGDVEEVISNADDAQYVEQSYFKDRQNSIDKRDPQGNPDKSDQDNDFVSVGELELQDSLDLNELRIKTTKKYKVKEKQRRKLSGLTEMDESALNDSGDSIEGGRSRSNSRLCRQDSIEDVVNDKDKGKDTMKGNAENEDGFVEVTAEDFVAGESADANGLQDGLVTMESKQNEDDKPLGRDHVCNVCHAGFGTRNKLFQHIKEQGHALRADSEETNKKG
ncbi:predicted protein, partial [Nematostella vectensis]